MSRSFLKLLLLVSLPLLLAQTNPRVRAKFDFGWKFMLGDVSVNCPNSTFPINMTGKQCRGLSQAAASSQTDCQNVCCADDACAVWQWCPSSGSNCSPASSCWIGNMNDCGSGGTGWISQGRTISPPSDNCTVAFCQPDYDDSQWRNLNVPHDYVIEGTFTPDGDESHGYLPHGVAWYRKHFTLPADYNGQIVMIHFDGVYRDSDVYLNGQYLGTHPSGYTSFFYDITTVAIYGGGDNVLAVRVDASEDEGWWYEGGGIYRHVWLEKFNPVHVITWGAYTTSVVSGTITQVPAPQYERWDAEYVASSATMTIVTNVTNNGTSSVTVQVTSQVMDPSSNQQIGSTATTQITISPNGGLTAASQTISLSSVTLWDITAPKLYNVIISVKSTNGNTLYDQLNVTTGIRKTQFDANTGFYLNGRNLKIKGLCNHQDFAGTGTAVPDRVNEFRVSKLQEMGANGWRMSHNPPNPELLHYTDTLGMLVWDENRNFGNSPQYLDDMSRMVLRDRNHPSIIFWSLCNEGGCEETAGDSTALEIAQQLDAIAHTYDPVNTRPVSAAWNADEQDMIGGWGPKVLDVQGVNYNYGEYSEYHSVYPAKPMIASETASCTCARGIYVTNDTAVHKDVYSADSCAQQWWTADATTDYIEGGFAWTGFDYKGEPTPYNWPDVNSNFGILDLAGFPKDTFWYYQSWWIDSPVLHIFPHWNGINTADVGTYASSCNGQQSQTWNFTGVGTSAGVLQSLDNGNCLNGACSNITNGCGTLSFAKCNSSDQAQLFSHNSDNSFKNVQSQGCLDLWNSGSGPNVGIWNCVGDSNQKWVINGKTIQSQATNPSGRCLDDTYIPGVWAYSNADSVELFVNGNSQGKQKVPQLGHVSWDVSYVPGTLSAVAYDSTGQTIAKQSIQTTGSPATISLSIEFPSDTSIHADGQDVALIRVAVVDSNGLEVPTASNVINFSVTGPGTLYGVGNGDPGCHEPDKGSSRSLFNGLARAIVQSTTTPGSIILTASSNGLKSQNIQIISQ